MMEVDERPLTDSKEEERDWPGRWDHVRKLLERRGPFAHPSFEPSPECLTFVRDACKLLVVGAGGLGCELLKDLALMGFKHIHVIDMDTIDISNLNRQFLFRQKDVGRSKAEVASEFINSRIPGTNVVPHDCKIQDKDESFYRKFHIIVCGLDSVVARRWINGMVISLLSYDDDGNLDQSTIIPIIDGGTEGFKGNARIVYPGITACIECTLDLFPPQINFPLCTIAHTPRLPEHCIEYVRVLQWAKENPFGGEDVAIDGDDPAHITWILDKALERSAQYNIRGVTYRLTQGVIKHIIAAVASTNGVVAAAMAMETFKVATSCANPLQNYMVFNQVDGIYTYSYEASRNENCLACNQKPRVLNIEKGQKLQKLLDLLTCQSGQYQMRSPGLTTTTTDGRHKTLYMQNVSSIEQVTRPNLKKTLEELGVEEGAELVVADVTTPNAIVFKISFSDGIGIVGQE